MISVEQILLADGPCLSSALARKLEAKGLSASAARQRISRAPTDKVRRLSGLIFPNNVRFLYHEKHFDTPDYWDALIRDIDQSNSAYRPAIAALQARQGVIPLHHFSIASGSPIKQRGQVSSATVLERLEAVGLVRRDTLPDIGEVVILKTHDDLAPVFYPLLIARLTVENILLSALRDWARRLGIASYGKVAIRGQDNLPKFATFHWDLSGPSYMAPLVTRTQGKAPKPGFLVCDVIAGSTLSKDAVTPFIRKFTLSRALKGLPPFLPILLADGYENEAFNEGRSQGLMLATPSALFGKDVAAGLEALLDTMGKAAAVATKRPESIGLIFDKLGAIEGAAGNLRGALFELVVGHVTHNRRGGSIDIGVLLQHDQDRVEVDVRRYRDGDVWLYECKGYQPDAQVDAPEIKDWLDKKAPLIYKATMVSERFRNSNVHIEFWTSGDFTDEAIAVLKEYSSKVRKYSICWKSGRQIQEELSRLDNPGVGKMFKEHFLRHPLTRINRQGRGIRSLPPP